MSHSQKNSASSVGYLDSNLASISWYKGVAIHFPSIIYEAWIAVKSQLIVGPILVIGSNAAINRFWHNSAEGGCCFY
jgi:hypothetical protein